MDATFKRALVRAWGKRALAPTPNMLTTLAAKGYGDDLTPIQTVTPNPDFDLAAYDPASEDTWPWTGGKGALLPDKNNPKHANKPEAVPGGWRGYRLTPQDIARFDRKSNGAGIVCRDDPADGKCVAWIDCDITEFGASSNTLHALRSRLAALGIAQFPVRRRGGPSWLVPMLITDGVPAYDKCKTKRGGYSLERGGAGHQFVALGQHACGAWRYWTRCDQTTETPLAEVPARGELPELTFTQFYKLFEDVAAACGAVKDGGKRGSGGAPSSPRLLPAEDFTHNAVPDDRKDVFLAVLAELPNTKTRDAWVGCSDVLIGCMRNWPRDEARAAKYSWDDRYDGPVDPAASEKLFDEKWKERGRLRKGLAEFFGWARAEIPYSRLRKLGVTDDDLKLADAAAAAESEESRAAREGFAEALQALAEARTEAGQAPVQAKKGRLVDTAASAGLPKKPPAVTDWHTRGVLGMLASAPGAGKTTFACLTAVAIAHERPDLIGSRTMDWGGAIVLVLNETDADTARATLTAAEAHFGLRAADRKYPIILRPPTLTLMARTSQGTTAPTPEAVAFVTELAELREDHPLALIVVDTLATTLQGLNENDASDMQAAAGMFGGIARAGHCPVQVTHHTRKPAPGKQITAADVRGSTALIGAARCVLMLRGVEQSRFQENEVLELSCVKRNDAPTSAPVFLARTEVPVDVEDPRRPGIAEQSGYAVLHPATPVPAFATVADIYATYDALEAAQASGIELRNAGQAKGKGWARPQTVICETLRVSKQEAETRFMDILDCEWVRLAAPASRRTRSGQNKGRQRHGVYELIRQDVV